MTAEWTPAEIRGVADGLDHLPDPHATVLANAFRGIADRLEGRIPPTENPVAGSAGDEESIDLTPGVVWTDGQIEVVKQLRVRVVAAEARARRVEELADEFDAELYWRERGVGHRIRRALDPKTKRSR